MRKRSALCGRRVQASYSTTWRPSTRGPRRCSSGLTPADLDVVVDERWDPPVTMGVRLVSIADDCLQHVGQAAYVRGLLDLGQRTNSE